jgi:hypothetical protein
MKYTVFSYRYAQEILEHPTNLPAWEEITGVVAKAPLFVHLGKSGSNAKLDVVQQCLNTWFDRALAVEHGWAYHPLATRIKKSKLAADFRKGFPNIRIQAEVQFGNMSRWYSDIFKLQAAYSQNMADLGLSIVPMGSLAKRIDSNVVTYERVIRELPSANLSITVPILVLGIEADEHTLEVDLRKVGFPLSSLTKRNDKHKTSEKNRYRLVHALFTGTDPASVDDQSDTGPMPSPEVNIPDEDN